MDNTSHNLLLSFAKEQPYENLTKEILIILLRDSEKINADWGEAIANDEESQNLKKEVQRLTEFIGTLQENHSKTLKDLKCLKAVQEDAVELEKRERALSVDCQKLTDENDSLKKKLNLKNKAEGSSEVEIELMHRKAFDGFLVACCKWSAKRIKGKDDSGKLYEVAAGSTTELYKNFKDWAISADLVIGKSKSKLIPSKDQFARWCVEEHKKRFPEDWRQNGLHFPLSPNGSHQTPRVNIHLIRDPCTGEELYKNKNRINNSR